MNGNMGGYGNMGNQQYGMNQRQMNPRQQIPTMNMNYANAVKVNY
jgi:hypothetical protein